MQISKKPGPKVALVTGAGSGIGRAVARALWQAGYAVVLAGRRADALQETARMAPPHPEQSAGQTSGAAHVAIEHVPPLVVPTDVCREDEVDALFAQTLAHFGRVDVLFNNAGTSAPALPIDELGTEEWRRVIDVNLTGAFLCARAAFHAMRTQTPQGGRIINNGSVSSQMPRPFSAPYTASKHAVLGLTRSLALDGRQWDIACSQIDIGNAASDMTTRMQEGVLQADLSLAPEPRIDLRHVADAVLYIAGLPLTANVLNMTVMATKMPLVGRG